MENDLGKESQDKKIAGAEIKEAEDPGIQSVWDYMVYGTSLPERTLRSTAVMVGGALTESAELLVPQAFRDSKSYQTFVQQMLDMMVQDIGGIESTPEDSSAEESQNVENYVARKTVGGFLDFAGMATLHLSPVLILAVVSDLAYGSSSYLEELADQLKEEGVIANDSSIENVSELLDAIGEVSGETASVFDTPPIDIEGLREMVQQTADKIAQVDPTLILPKSELDQMWSDMNAVSESQGIGLLELSSGITMYTLNQIEYAGKGALTTIRVSGELLDRHVISHYWDGLEEISEKGFYAIVAESSQPYVQAVWENFSTTRPTITEDVLSGKLAGKVWNGVRAWFVESEQQQK